MAFFMIECSMHVVASACNTKVFHRKVGYNKTMLFLKERLENVPIMSLQTGAQIAQTGEFVIDPRQLKVVAFYCVGSRLDVNPAILHVSDIREIGSLGIIVDDADVLMSPGDLVRLQEVLGYHFKLNDKQVVTESGKKLGTVANFTLDSTTLYIVKLHVRPGMFKAFMSPELIIDRQQIVQVTDDEVVVKDTAKREEAKAAPVAQVMENPFRRSPVEGAASHHAKE
jgi:uncharacterized protein YrrD